MNIRHGDMALIGIDTLPDGLEASADDVLMKGSGGNDHKVRSGVFFPKTLGVHVIGYLQANPGCHLLHPDHGASQSGSELKSANVPPGLYEVRRQTEDTHSGMVPVVD